VAEKAAVAKRAATKAAPVGRLGIDIGGSGIKGAPVDLASGKLLAERVRLETPAKGGPQAVLDVVCQVATAFVSEGPIGVTFPGVVAHGVVHTAANMDKGWIGLDLARELRRRLRRPVVAMNDADAAGVAEMTFGAGRRAKGVVVMITLGTGIGCAVFNDGVLLPNTEFGHLELDGRDAEERAAARVRDEDNLSWPQYAERVERYLKHLDRLLWPDRIIIGGGVSKKADKFLPLMDIRCPVVPARLLNDAGIVGAALLANR
jgi:polyphosphate glucokinase